MPGGPMKPNNELAKRGEAGLIKLNPKPGEPFFPTDNSGNIIPGNYATKVGEVRVKKLEPAKAYDVINVARAMNEDFAPRVQELFSPEVEACMEALKTGFYISYRPTDPPYDKQDCIRIYSRGRCFCSHLLNQHAPFSGREAVVKCNTAGCKCKAFAWVPSRPEESGEFWLPKRRGYDPTAYRAKCRCKHTHEEHEEYPAPHRCRVKGCGCSMFHSAFVCAACDQHWHQHRTVFETEGDRRREGRPVGQEWFPFAELPDMVQIALTGQDNPSIQVLADALPVHLREKMVLDQAQMARSNLGGPGGGTGSMDLAPAPRR